MLPNDVYIDIGDEREYDLDSEFESDGYSPYDYGGETENILNTGMIFTEGSVFDDR